MTPTSQAKTIAAQIDGVGAFTFRRRTLRDEIKTMATHIAEGDSDECADEFDDLLEDFKVRTVTKLADDDVEEFHAEAKKIVSKYYELED